MCPSRGRAASRRGLTPDPVLIDLRAGAVGRAIGGMLRTTGTEMYSWPAWRISPPCGEDTEVLAQKVAEVIATLLEGKEG